MTTHRKPWYFYLALFTLFSLVAAACGGSDADTTEASTGSDSAEVADDEEEAMEDEEEAMADEEEAMEDEEEAMADEEGVGHNLDCLLYTSPSPRDATLSRMPSSA